MKITCFLILISALSVFAGKTYSQTKMLNLNMENVSVKAVLSSIEDQSEFYFFFSDKIIDVNRKVSINAEDQNIETVLKSLFSGTDVTYVVKDRIIVLTTPEVSQAESQQSKNVTGKVTDQSGVPIPGASVVVKGTTIGVTTNNDGSFSIVVTDNSNLQFSFVGMKTQEIAVGNKTTINVMLTEEAINLEEVVAVGYGTQKRASLTGSVATVSADKLTIAPMASTTNTLAGRLPGLISKQQSGLAGGDAATLSIRGFDAPLLIVDGIESSFNNIGANEIESISVLKDASSAIYGSRAGNGVILVTTKRGNIDKPTITLNSSMSYQGVSFLAKMASSGQMAELNREEHLNSGKPETTQRFKKEEVDLFYAGTNPDYPNTDWLKLLARDWAPEQEHNLSVRGGSDKIKYYGFLGYLDQLTMWKTNGGEYQRYNIRSNIDAKISDNLSAQFDLSSIVENRNFSARADERQNSVWQEYWNTEPMVQATLPDPTKTVNSGLLQTTNSAIIGYRKTNSQNIKASFSLNYTFNKIKGLSAKAFANYNQDYSFSKQFSFIPCDSWSYNYSNKTYTQKSFAVVPTLGHQDYKNRVLTGQLSLNFDRTFSEVHHLTALALFEVIDYNNDWIQAARTGYQTKTIDYLFAGGIANQTNDGRASEMGRQSYIGRLNYAYKSKYLLESTFRIDQSAKFNAEGRTGYFPSISLGWRLSDENFIKNNIPTLENLKLRASVSQTGNDAVGNFQYLSGYVSDLSYIINTAAYKGINATGMANPLLTWETMTIYNTGLDFSLNKRKLYGEMDLFYRDRAGIPGTRVVSLPSTFGATLPTENLNSINTRGFELLLGNEGKWRDLKWDVSANISWSRSKWGFYDEPVYTDPDQSRQSKRTGQWTDRLFGYVSEGLFTTQAEIDALTYKYNETQGNVSLKPGDVRFKDTNGDGLLNWKDMVEIGKGTMPHWMGGLSLNLNYKNFDMSALFQGAFGFTQLVNLRWGGNYSQLYYNERWTPANNNRNGLIPRLGGATSNGWSSDYYNKKSDYVRLKTFSLGYNLPNSLISRAGLQKLRLYVAGTNLFTFSGLNKYSIDPEAPNGYGGYYYPQMRTITFGLNLSL